MKPQIRLVRPKDISRRKWDACIRGAQNSRPYGYTWYLDCFAPGWRGLVLGDYQSVMPITGRERWGIKYLVTPVFMQQLGVYSPMPAEEIPLEGFLAALPRFHFTDYCLNSGNRPLEEGPYRILNRTNLEVSLGRSYEELKASYSTKCRRNIRLAEKHDQELIAQMTPGALMDLYFANKGREIKGIKTIDYSRLQAFMEDCLANDRGTIYGIRKEGTWIYGLFTVETCRYVTCLFTVNSPASRSMRSGYFAIDRLIRNKAGNDIILDFAGSEVPSVATFMQSFGAIARTYPRILQNRLPLPVRYFRKMALKRTTFHHLLP